MSYEEVESVLQTYTFEDILELNDCTVEDALYFLVSQEFLELPNPGPVQ
jgi:hypothetical protein